MDLHILAATAHQLEAQTGKGLSSSQGSLHWSTQPVHHKPCSLSEVDNEMEFDPGPVPRSSDSAAMPKFAGAITKHTKHRAAEQRRRERINERLQALRELVPHDTRSNTATFLEGVITYIQNLQQSNAALEAELSGLKAMRAAAQAGYEQQQEFLAQPAGSGSNPANSYHQPNQQQQQQSHLLGSSWRQDSITGASPHSPEAAAVAAAAAAAGGHHWQHAIDAAAAAATVPDSKAGSVPVQQQPRQHAALSAVCAAEQRQTLSSSPPLPHAAAASAAPALSAPAALMQGLLQSRSGTAAGAGGVPAASSSGPPSLQPVELQSVLEKALLAALQQQAQQLATQMLGRGN